MQILKYLLIIVANAIILSIVFIYKKKHKLSIPLIIAFLVVFVFSIYINIDPSYYDRYGNRYKDLDSVVYYTEDDYQYIFDTNKYEFTCMNYNSECKYKKTYESGYAYIDENGYLFFTNVILDNDKENPLLSENPNKPGTYCMFAECVHFDREGKTEVNKSSNSILDSILLK